jgi:hypothetical protein
LIGTPYGGTGPPLAADAFLLFPPDVLLFDGIQLSSSLNVQKFRKPLLCSSRAAHCVVVSKSKQPHVSATVRARVCTLGYVLIAAAAQLQLLRLANRTVSVGFSFETGRKSDQIPLGAG